jgi:hypothetical protein
MFYSSMQAIYNSLIVHVSEQSEDHLTWLSATQVTDCHALPAAGRPRSESKTNCGKLVGPARLAESTLTAYVCWWFCGWLP